MERLAHAHVVQLAAVGTTDRGCPFAALELCAGDLTHALQLGLAREAPRARVARARAGCGSAASSRTRSATCTSARCPAAA